MTDMTEAVRQCSLDLKSDSTSPHMIKLNDLFKIKPLSFSRHRTFCYFKNFVPGKVSQILFKLARYQIHFERREMPCDAYNLSSELVRTSQ